MSAYERCSTCGGDADVDLVECVPCQRKTLERIAALEARIEDLQEQVRMQMEERGREIARAKQVEWERDEERARLDAMIAGGWSVERWTPGGWVVHDAASRTDADALPVGSGETPRAAIDAARKGG